MANDKKLHAVFAQVDSFLFRIIQLKVKIKELSKFRLMTTFFLFVFRLIPNLNEVAN